MLALFGFGVALAQGPPAASLPAGTKIKAELRSALDTAHAKVGASVRAVTTADVKLHGRKLLPKGSQLSGAIVSVTPAESPKSPSHIAVVFTQARTKKGQVLALVAVIVRVHRIAVPQPPARTPAPMPAPMQNPEMTNSDRQNGKPTATLGSMAIPSQITDQTQAMVFMRRTSQQNPIQVSMEGNKSSVLTSRGNFTLARGTRVELKQLTVLPGDHSGAGSH
ncbi:MAG: hypothetical protein ACRD0Y_05165 [Terriglobales bacterium]